MGTDLPGTLRVIASYPGYPTFFNVEKHGMWPGYEATIRYMYRLHIATKESGSVTVLLYAYI